MYVTLLVANCRVGDANARMRYPLTGAEMKHISLQGNRNVIKNDDRGSILINSVQLRTAAAAKFDAKGRKHRLVYAFLITRR